MKIVELLWTLVEWLQGVMNYTRTVSRWGEMSGKGKGVMNYTRTVSRWGEMSSR